MLKFLKKKRPRLLVIGLDGFAPDLVLSQWRSQLPTFDRLLSEGAFSRLQSSTPCASIPAWNVMVSGKDAGTLGIFGAENRYEGTYDGVRSAVGCAAQEPPVWEILGEAGKRVVTMGVPGTYPPRQVNGAQVSCALTPATVQVDALGHRHAAEFTYPTALAEQINHWAEGEYPVDIHLDSHLSLEGQIAEIWRMTDLHFKVMHNLLNRQMWDFFMTVEVGAARLQERFWRYSDAGHIHYPGATAFEDVIRDYYIHIDGKIEQLLNTVDNETAVMIVSDRGVQSSVGSICVNDWLAGEEWLTYAGTPPDQVVPFQAENIDWSKTLAWGEGGAYTRFYLNVEGRETDGVIPWSRYLHMRDELIARIRELRGPHGERLKTQIFKPEETYRHLHGCVPDLIVYWDNLRWHSISAIGHQTIWAEGEGSDVAPTDEGLYIYWHPKRKFGGHELTGWEAMDIAPTILDYFQVAMPIEMQGRKMPLKCCQGDDHGMVAVSAPGEQEANVTTAIVRPKRRRKPVSISMQSAIRS